MADQTARERRRFSRIPFDAIANIRSEEDDEYLNCVVVDVSLKGLLIVKPGQWQIHLGQTCLVELLLEQRQIIIQMHTVVAHIDEQSVGFEVLEMDLDSLTHLKRLVELNLGDDQLLHRELSALRESH